jgi:hypothetical protein
MRQSKWRRAARLAQAEARARGAELEQLKEQLRETNQLPKPLLQSSYQPRLTIAPPAA